MLPITAIGAVVAGCIAGIVGITLLAMVLTRDCNPLSFLRRTTCTPPPPAQDLEAQSTVSESGEFETYGKLILPPDRQPTHVALDSINRMLLVPGLPANTTASANHASQPPSSRSSVVSSAGGEVVHLVVPPRLSLHLPRPSSKTPSEEVRRVMSESEASSEALVAGREFARRLKDAAKMLKDESREQDLLTQIEELVGEAEVQDVFVVGGEEEKEEVEQGRDEVVVDPMSFTVGSGKAMAGLYR